MVVLYVGSVLYEVYYYKKPEQNKYVEPNHPVKVKKEDSRQAKRLIKDAELDKFELEELSLSSDEYDDEYD